jgi:hypothetical protein
MPTMPMIQSAWMNMMIDSDDVVNGSSFEDDDVTIGAHKNRWTLRMKFLCARNTPNLNRRENACHCRLSDCEHVGTYSVSRIVLFGDVREGRTSSSCVGGRSRE